MGGHSISPSTSIASDRLRFLDHYGGQQSGAKKRAVFNKVTFLAPIFRSISLWKEIDKDLDA